LVGLAARGVLLALMEWSRKSELSADRAGLLAVQDPEAALRAMLRLAGGGDDDQMHLPDFLDQADEYREGGDLADAVFKVLALLPATHPFHVLRAGELRDWVEEGDYDRILRGEYHRRDDDRPPYREDLRRAARAYAESAGSVMDRVGDAARRFRDAFAEGFRPS
ncbi:MAG: M48 family metalloprotease, partial [Gemmatimonadota bacterium]